MPESVVSRTYLVPLTLDQQHTEVCRRLDIPKVEGIRQALNAFVLQHTKFSPKWDIYECAATEIGGVPATVKIMAEKDSQKIRIYFITKDGVTTIPLGSEFLDVIIQAMETKEDQEHLFEGVDNYFTWMIGYSSQGITFTWRLWEDNVETASMLDKREFIISEKLGELMIFVKKINKKRNL